MPEVTVLTAVRNGEKYLSATIASIQAQTFTDWEYIIVDDGSVDDTPHIVNKFSHADDRISLVRRSRPGGPFLAAIEGAQYATGNYIVRTDGDDISLPQRIEHQLKFLKENTSLRACAAYCDVLTDTGVVLNYIYDPPLTSGALKWFLCLRNRLVHSSACIEYATFMSVYCESTYRSVYHGYSAADDSMRPIPDVEDYRMWCKLAREGTLGVVPEVLVHFRRHDARVSTTRPKDQHILALDVLSEHLHALSHRPWSQTEVSDLYTVGHSMRFPIDRGIQLLNEWDRMWKADSQLADRECQDLSRISQLQKRTFLVRNMRHQPLAFLQNLTAFF